MIQVDVNAYSTCLHRGVGVRHPFSIRTLSTPNLRPPHPCGCRRQEPGYHQSDRGGEAVCFGPVPCHSQVYKVYGLKGLTLRFFPAVPSLGFRVWRSRGCFFDDKTVSRVSFSYWCLRESKGQILTIIPMFTPPLPLKHPLVVGPKPSGLPTPTQGHQRLKEVSGQILRFRV